MATDHLRAALHTAGIQPDQLADDLGVNPRTIRRWLNGQLPFPRHRAKIARLLDTTEQAIWPDIPQPSAGATTRSGGDEIVGYAVADAPGSPNPLELITAATRQIDLIDHSLSRPLSHPDVVQLFIAKANAGTRIRIMVTEPGEHLGALLGQPGIEVRVLDTARYRPIYRCDNVLLVLLLVNHADQLPPLLHIQRRSPDGIFDRLVTDYESDWEDTATPLVTKHNLETHLEHDARDAVEAQADQGGSSASHSVETRPSRDTADSPGRRRWPGRRD